MLKNVFDSWPRANVAIAVIGLALIGIVWAFTLERVRFETAAEIADVAKRNANLAIALEEHTIRTLKGIDQALLFVSPFTFGFFYATF